ncbi:quinon protein alcohol dehydrogenase-like superfamily [Halteromyces radiatus]|uniref:quinon protein alcohol dehydrogenase-like superfamily n=1 Tax=Halteromyces radiatus TaxID=101107 RepID=UPI0022202A73|nr:quinon protein alcohol dehydrogenase-like superfamily [Halteromyces radiatus]KAI8088913.1 quinon protein alcohol dehydrogenase-like superfamily [Halteromyces radiatus]
MEVHRCRFVEYQPATINTMDFTPASVKHTQLAVGRANGDIELWDPRWNYRLEKVIPGGHGQSVESLVWAHQSILVSTDTYDDPKEMEDALKQQLAQPPRLFSSSLNPYIVEWDPVTLTAKKTVDSNGGSVWCLAVNSNGTRLAAGCEDGCIRLFDISDDQLEYIRSFESQKGRILSISWGPDDSYIVTGGSDSSVRKWNVQHGRTTHRMTVDKKNKEATMVWSVVATKHNTIISGDSLGHLMFWDSELGTMKQSIKAHAADILSVVVSRDGNMVFSSGVDRKLLSCKRVQSQKDKKKTAPGTWTTVGNRRYHYHDVRTLALDERPGINSIVSGGVDCELVVSPAMEFPRLIQNRLPPFARKYLVSISKSHKLVMAQIFDTISIWRLGQAGPLDLDTKGSIPDMYVPHKFLAKLQLKDDCYITSAALSENAQWIAACDVENVRLFSLQHQDEESGQLTVKKMRSFELSLAAYLAKNNLALGAHHVVFTPSSDKLIVVTVESKILVIDLSHWDQGEFEVLAEFGQHTPDAHSQHSTGTVINIAVSEDGQWLATGDDHGNTYVFSLDSLKRHFTVPRMSFPQTTLSFNAFRPNELLVAYANNTFRIYDVEHKCQTSWSKKHMDQQDSLLARQRDRIRGVIYNPANKNDIVLYGSQFMAKVDMSTSSKGKKGNQHKRKADQVDSNNNAPIVNEKQRSSLDVSLTVSYQQILHCDFIDKNSMVMVERRKESVLENLPPSFYHARFNK